MKKRNVCMAVLAACAVFFAQTPLMAASDSSSSNFQIAPPPIPYPNFEVGRQDMRVDGMYVSLKADGMKFSGAGVNFAARKVFNQKVALSGGIMFAGMSGDLDYGGYSMKPSLMMMNFSGVAEYQPIKNDKYGMILFAGLGIPFNYISFDKYWTNTAKTIQYTPNSISMVMMNMPIGVQGDITLGNFKLAPYMKIDACMGGTATMNYTYSTYGDTSFTIDPYTSTSLGMDIIYVPWDISVGTMFQQMAQSSSGSGNTKVFMLQLTWHRTKYAAGQQAESFDAGTKKAKW